MRKVFAIRRTKRLYKESLDRKLAIAERENKKKEMAEGKRRKEIERRLHPRTSKDFETLYNGLEKWRHQETKKIEAADLEEPVRLALMADLLEKEAQLIQKIDRLKLAANDENKALRIQKMIDDASSTVEMSSINLT